jgi:hypothetical protein
MPAPHRSPFPPLELDLEDESSTTGVRPAAMKKEEGSPQTLSNLATAATKAPDSDVRPTVRLAELLRKRDFMAALAVADQLLAADPSDLTAKEARVRCHRELEASYSRRLGSLQQVPSLAVSVGEIPSLAIDNRSAFVLSFVDGVSSIEMILDMSGMARFEALRLLYGLVRDGVLSLC